VLTGAVALACALAACTPGAYPADVFPEMHYQRSQRRLEPDRKSPPAEAVPVSGGRPTYTFEQAAAQPNPIVRSPETLQRASEVYRINCAMCHGTKGDGRGAMADYFARAAAEPPTDLTGARPRARTDGQLQWIVSYGLGNMPAFRALLSEDDVWSAVLFIRELQAGRGAGATGAP
jgi:mono/diheme cytochrome c family protein